MKDTTEEKRTLLGQYIHDRAQEYIEPIREGTPRGEPVGFSSVKYAAVLYALMNTKQKEVAERLEVSHGLLRKWHTEQAFKNAIDEHCLRFSDLFISNLRDRVKRNQALSDAYLAQPLKKIASQNQPSLGYFEVSDAGFYSRKLRGYISMVLFIETELAIKEENIDMEMEIYGMSGALRYFYGKGKPETTIKGEENLRRQLAKSIIESGIEILLKPDFSEKDKKQLLINLKSIAKGFE